MSLHIAWKWDAEFKRGRDNLEDDPRWRRLITVTTQETIAKIHDIIMVQTNNALLHCHRVGFLPGPHPCSHPQRTSKVSARCVPKLIGPDFKRTRLTMSRENLVIFLADSNSFLQRFVTMDETMDEEATTGMSAGKVMASIFWDAEGVLLVDHLDKGHISF